MSAETKFRIAGVVSVLGLAAWIWWLWEQNKASFPSFTEFLKAFLRSPTQFGLGRRDPGAIDGNSPPPTGDSEPDSSQPGMSITVDKSTGTVTGSDNGPDAINGVPTT